MKRVLIAISLITFWFATAQQVPTSNNRMSRYMTDYLKIQEALAADDFNRASSAAKSLQSYCETLGLRTPPYNEIHKNLEDLVVQKDIKSFRKSFKGYSKNMLALLKKEGQPPDVFVAECPMANAKWIQRGKQLRNPYYGKEMLECGSII